MNSVATVTTNPLNRISGLTEQEYYDQRLKKYRQQIVDEGLSVYVVYKPTQEIAFIHLVIDIVEDPKKVNAQSVEQQSDVFFMRARVKFFSELMHHAIGSIDFKRGECSFVLFVASNPKY